MPADAHGGQSPERAEAPDDLLPRVYQQLRVIAQRQMAQERPGHTLSATALIHEAYLRMSGTPRGAPLDRMQFLHAAAEAMRRILIEHARARGRQKRGGRMARLSLDSIGEVADLASEEQRDHIAAFDEAFRRLEAQDARLAGLVRLRFFAGLSNAETAAALGVSERTVNTDWVYVRAWMARELMRERKD